MVRSDHRFKKQVRVHMKTGQGEGETSCSSAWNWLLILRPSHPRSWHSSLVPKILATLSPKQLSFHKPWLRHAYLVNDRVYQCPEIPRLEQWNAFNYSYHSVSLLFIYEHCCFILPVLVYCTFMMTSSNGNILFRKRSHAFSFQWKHLNRGTNKQYFSHLYCHLYHCEIFFSCLCLNFSYIYLAFILFNLNLVLTPAAIYWPMSQHVVPRQQWQFAQTWLSIDTVVSTLGQPWANQLCYPGSNEILGEASSVCTKLWTRNGFKTYLFPFSWRLVIDNLARRYFLLGEVNGW